MTDVAKQVLKQIEFYFGDSNFRRDRFLQAETQKHADGFVPFSVLFTFKKLAALTTDAQVLADACKESQIVELNEKKDAMRRKSPLPSKDESASRTLVLAGLGSSFPTIEEIKQAFASFNCELLFIDRKRFRNMFSGVIWIEFEKLEDMQKVEASIAAKEGKVKILNHLPSALCLEKYLKLSREEQVEFQKSIKAMLVAKDVPSSSDEKKSVTFFQDELLNLWQEDKTLRPRIKWVSAQNELYLLYTQVAFAKKALELLQAKPISIEEQPLTFELVTDKESIAKRPRTHPDEKSSNQKKRKHEEVTSQKTIHLTNIGPKVRLDNIKKMISLVWNASERSPYVDFEDREHASFSLPEAKAIEIFEKLQQLSEENKTLGGQVVKFELLNANEEFKKEVVYEKGLILKFQGVNEQVSRDEIKATINEKVQQEQPVKEEPEEEEEQKQKPEGVAFIKYEQGDGSGYLRVTSAAIAKQILALATSEEGIQVGTSKLDQVHLVEGEEEKKFWEEAQAARNNRFKQTRQNKRQQQTRGGGRRH